MAVSTAFSTSPPSPIRWPPYRKDAEDGVYAPLPSFRRPRHVTATLPWLPGTSRGLLNFLLLSLLLLSHHSRWLPATRQRSRNLGGRRNTLPFALPRAGHRGKFPSAPRGYLLIPPASRRKVSLFSTHEGSTTLSWVAAPMSLFARSTHFDFD